MTKAEMIESMAQVKNTDDVFDSRDLLEHIQNLEAISKRDETEDEELKQLKSVVQQFHEIYDEKKNYLKDGIGFIRDSYFLAYQTDFFLEVNQVDEALQHYIDFEAFADDEMYGYSEVLFDGVTYHFRNF